MSHIYISDRLRPCVVKKMISFGLIMTRGETVNNHTEGYTTASGFRMFRCRKFRCKNLLMNVVSYNIDKLVKERVKMNEIFTCYIIIIRDVRRTSGSPDTLPKIENFRHNYYFSNKNNYSK